MAFTPHEEIKLLDVAIADVSWKKSQHEKVKIDENGIDAIVAAALLDGKLTENELNALSKVSASGWVKSEGLHRLNRRMEQICDDRYSMGVVHPLASFAQLADGELLPHHQNPRDQSLRRSLLDSRWHSN
jgi:hypothetical protein